MQKRVAGGCKRKLRDKRAEKETKDSAHFEVLVWSNADHLLAKEFGAFYCLQLDN